MNITAWTNSRPMPGHWNTVSVTSAKAIRSPISMPVMVITGIRQLLQRMAEMDQPVRQAAGAGEFDVVGAQHLQHLGRAPAA